MNRLLTVCVLAVVLHSTAQAQRQIQTPRSTPAVDVGQLEGVTFKHGRTSLLVLANATVQKSVQSSLAKPLAGAASTAPAATLLQKVGAYEIHRTPLVANASVPAALSVNGKAVPAFADAGTGRDFVGAAYVYDTQQLGLISKEIAVKFKNGTVPASYADSRPVELVRGSGLYVFTVADIYAWIKLVSRLQADPQVGLTEPHIVTHFATAQ